MKPTLALGRQTLRLTFFTRPNCGLCTVAKEVMAKVWHRRPYEYDEIDVMAAKQTKWKNLYEFDTPVLHIDRAQESDMTFETHASARKLMHRFTEQQLESAMDETENASNRTSRT